MKFFHSLFISNRSTFAVLSVVAMLNLLLPVLGKAQQHWFERYSFSGEARSGAVAASLNGKAYMGMGDGSGSGVLADWWAYDPATDTWTQKADFPGAARYDAVAFAAAGKVYVGTGYDGTNYYKDFYAYDPVTDSWEAVADLPAEARADAVAVSVGETAYVGTGEGTGTSHADWWQYDPATDSWTQKASLSSDARKQAIAFNVNGKLFLGAGFTFDNGYSQFTNDFYSYDPATDSWTEESFAEPQLARTGAATFVVGDTAYIVGGKGKSDYWKYAAATNEWVQGEEIFYDYKTGPDRAVGFALEGKGYFFTGAYDSESYQYPRRSKWGWKYFPEKYDKPSYSSFTTEEAYYDHVVLQWAASERAEGYELYRGVDLKDLVLIATLPAGVTEYVDETVEEDQLYYYTIRAFNEIGKTQDMDLAALKVPKFLNPPSSLKVSTLNQTTLKLNWKDNSDNEAGFMIEMSEGDVNNFQEIANLGANVNHFEVNGLTTGQVYYFRIVSYTNEPAVQEVSEYSGGMPDHLHSWKEVVPLSETKMDIHSSFTTNNYGFFIYSDEKLYQLDAQNNVLIEKTAPASRIGFLFMIEDRAYFINNGSETWEYEVATDQWTQKADYPGPKVYYRTNFSLNGKGYRVGGALDATASLSERVADVWEYDPQTDNWTQKADFPGGNRSELLAFTNNGKAFVGLGAQLTDGKYHRPRDFYEYESQTDSWTRLKDVPFANDFDTWIGTRYHTATVGQYCFFKEEPMATPARKAPFWRYDYTQDAWHQIAAIPEDYSKVLEAFTYNGKLAAINTKYGNYDNPDRGYTYLLVYDQNSFGPVTDLTFESYESDTLTLSWTDSFDGEDGYYLMMERGSFFTTIIDTVLVEADTEWLELDSLKSFASYQIDLRPFKTDKVAQEGNVVTLDTEETFLNDEKPFFSNVFEQADGIKLWLGASTKNADRIILERSIDYGSFEVIDTVAKGTDYYDVKNFEFQTVAYRARLLNSFGAGRYSDVERINNYLSPEDMKLEKLADRQVKLSWTPQSIVYDDYYIKMYGFSEDSNLADSEWEIEVPTGTNEILLDLEEARFEGYEVFRVYLKGAKFEAQEEEDPYEVSETFTAYYYDLIMLYPPEELKIESSVNNYRYQIKLSWTEVSDWANSYRVSFKKSGQSDFEEYKTLSAGQNIIVLDHSFAYEDWEVEVRPIAGLTIGAGSYASFTALPKLILSGEEAQNQTIKLYPNPAQDQLKVSAPFQRAVYSLTDINGKKLLEGKMKQQTVIDVNELPEGIYILQIQSDGQVLTRRVVIER